MEAPRGALRHYNADELEPLSRAGLEALFMEIQDEYHLREGGDQLYVDATKPIRALLRIDLFWYVCFRTYGQRFRIQPIERCETYSIS